MSIRLRFTLLYTLILALTLAIFGISLYAIQAQHTLYSLKQDLVLSANRLAEATLRTGFRPMPPDNAFPRPIPFDEFSNEQEFQIFPELEIARVLDANGQLVTSPFGREGDTLPYKR